MKIQKIGYQGIEGSWSEEAAHIFIKKMNFKNAQIVPLISSHNVGQNMISGDVDYGVMAVKNSIGGIVEETADIMKVCNFLPISNVELIIHHCLFKKRNAPINSINKIASHEQAIKQTRKNAGKLLNKFEVVYSKDTALSAKLLSEDKYDDNTAVICSRKAGEKYGLDCIAKNIEDDKSITRFILLKNS